MVYEFIKLHHWHEEAEKRLWVQDHKGPDGEDYFALVEDAELISTYVILDDAEFGLNKRAEKFLNEGWRETMTDCNHIVGYRHGMNDALLIQSDEARDLEPSTFFIYCPKCGEKL